VSFEQLEADARARVGRVLNAKWTLERLMGVGGMAAVYGARHRNGARAAVKLLHPELARRPEVCERFLREGYAANRVEHRNAVQVLDDDIVKGGDDDGAAYLVMELLEGESLEERAAHPPPIGEQELLTIASGVLSVLESAHEHGVVHRDLKPDNIFLARDSGDGRLRIKVLDFGLACLIDLQRTTQFGLALGTPSYMSPEQAAGRSEEIDGRTDLFALGATAFRVLTLRRIHEADDPVGLVLRMANEPAPPIRSVLSTISEGLAAVIDRALAFRREDRYPSAGAMRADVDALRDAVVNPSSDRMPVAPPTTSNRLLQAAIDETVALSDDDEETDEKLEAAEPPIAIAPVPRRRSILPLLTIVLYVAILIAYLQIPQKTTATSRPDATTALVEPPTEPDASTNTEVSAVLIDAAAPEPDAEAVLDSEPDASESDASELDASFDAAKSLPAFVPTRHATPPAPPPRPIASVPKGPVHPPKRPPPHAPHKPRG
jgi:serine/threonine-protein kinase